MHLQTKVSSWILTTCLSTCALFAALTEPFSVVPAERREGLAKRLPGYVEAYKERKWEMLYSFVSDTGKGGATSQVFTAAMKSNHGKDFAQMPDLQEFRPDRTEKSENGFDIYGCGKAQREGMSFNGIVVIHAVFERGDWFFTGWRFTDFPNEPCKSLLDPQWQPDNRLKWDGPMEEIANLKQRGVPMHVDPPH